MRKRNFVKSTGLWSVLALAVLVCFVGLGLMSAGSQVKAAGEEPFVVGALLPMTGPWSSFGTSIWAGLRASLQVIRLEMLPEEAEIALHLFDTAGDPAQAMAGLKTMLEQGIRIVIGPATSEEALFVRDFAGANDMLLVSPSATAGNLSRDDNLIRLVPTDRNQVDALLQTMEAQGISTVAPVHIDDVYGQAFLDELETMASNRGIALLPAVLITTKQPDFHQVVAELETTMEGQESSAVLLIDSDKRALSLVRAIGYDSSLRQVKWYVGEGITLSAEAVADEWFAEFAARVAMEGFALSVDVDIFDSSIPLARHTIHAYNPDISSLTPFAFTAWDALRLIAHTHRQVGPVETAVFRSALMENANWYINLFSLGSGLDAYGDLLSSPYSRYRIIKAPDQPAHWQLVGVYVFEEGLPPFVIDFKRIYTADIGEITIGALLPLTGQMSESGAKQLQVLEVGLEVVRSHFGMMAPGLTFSLAVGDTGSSPEQALAVMRELHERGVHTFVGPTTSTEVLMVAPYAAEAGITLVTPGATAPSLAMQERVLRLLPHDGFQAEAMSELLAHYGFATAIGLFRDDIYGTELMEEFGSAYAGRVDFVSYDPADLCPADIVESLEMLLTELPDAVVLAGSFEEIANVLAAVNVDSPLLARRWFGFDGVANLRSLVEQPEIAAKAAQVHLTASTHGAYLSGISSVLDLWTSQLAGPVGAIGTAAYDALFFLASAWAEAGVSVDADGFWNTLIRSPYFYGAIGPVQIDENADVAVGGWYGFYTVVDTPSGPAWTKVGDYVFGFHGNALILAP